MNRGRWDREAAHPIYVDAILHYTIRVRTEGGADPTGQCWRRIPYRTASGQDIVTRTWSPPRGDARILMYSHDTMGLGHLRRCREIAHWLVARNDRLSVTILSGSPMSGKFRFHDRVRVVRLPAVRKLQNGDYMSRAAHRDIDQTVGMRESIISRTAREFDPHLFIVDKEPWGLRGEVRPALELLKSRGTALVLGLRDVLDEAAALVPEWERKDVLPALDGIYDDIWIYGTRCMCDPLHGLDLPRSVREKVRYTGYLQRRAPEPAPGTAGVPGEPYILVTAGGGGDGDGLMDWVLRAYEHDAGLPLLGLLVLGPFMPRERTRDLMRRAEALERIRVIIFSPEIEILMSNAAAIVAMGGYNSFCEILSFDKPALIVPRTEPRLEQLIRASRARDLGLVSMLVDRDGRDPEVMAGALRSLPGQARPSERMAEGMLNGLEQVEMLTATWLPDMNRQAVT